MRIFALGALTLAGVVIVVAMVMMSGPTCDGVVRVELGKMLLAGCR